MTYKSKLKEQTRAVNKKYKETLSIIKRLSYRQKLFSVLSIVLAFALVSAFTGSAGFPRINTVANGRSIIGAVKTTAKLEDYGTVLKHLVPNATQTVYYVPQIHKEPTSQPGDAVNDQATIIQKDIYKTLDGLINNNGVTYIMDETDLYGPMPQDKVEKVKAGFADVAQLRDSMNTALDHYIKDGGSPQVADGIRQATEKHISDFERNIYLTGGAAVVAAVNPDAHVYGSQNAATINEAKNQLQYLVYLENRINALSGTQKPSGGGTATSGTQSQQIQKILSSSMGGTSTSGGSASLNPVYTLSQQKQDNSLKSDADDFSAKYNKLSTIRSFETGSGITSASAAPADPYKNRTDLSALKAEYEQNYAIFLKLAKDQRSQEVSDNIVKQMNDNGQKSAVLVFGEQHKDQLVEALNKKGVSVVVITPPSEVTYLQSQSTTNATIK